MSRSRNWCFTWNNPGGEGGLMALRVASSYIIAGREVSSTGTAHIQGFVVFPNAKSLSAVRAFLPQAHWEAKSTLSTFKQASDYCKKDGDYEEYGTLPKDPSDKGKEEQDRWRDIIRLSENGDWETLKREYPVEYGQRLATLEKIRRKRPRDPQTIEGDMEHEWIVGKTGTGKSLAARQENPGAYIKDPLTGWWDHYEDEEVVIIDDFDKFQVKQGGEMKRWCDRYPFRAQVKGDYIFIRPRKIVVTSQYTPEQIWDDDKTVDAVRRRFTFRNFDADPPPINYGPQAHNHAHRAQPVGEASQQPSAVPRRDLLPSNCAAGETDRAPAERSEIRDEVSTTLLCPAHIYRQLVLGVPGPTQLDDDVWSNSQDEFIDLDL